MTTPLRGFVLASAESFIRIAGVTVLERALRTLHYEDISGLTVLCPEGEIPEGILLDLKAFNIPFTLSPLDERGRADSSLLSAEGAQQVLLLDGSALVDSRLPALLSQGGERFCFVPQECVPSRRSPFPDGPTSLPEPQKSPFPASPDSFSPPPSLSPRRPSRP